MTKSEIISILHRPQAITPDQTRALHELSKKYPWSQFVQLLYTKGLHNEKSVDYLDSLKYTAAITADRKQLYDQIMKPALIEKIKSIISESDDTEQEHTVKNSLPEIAEVRLPEEKSDTPLQIKTENNTTTDQAEKIVVTKEVLEELISRKVEEKLTNEEKISGLSHAGGVTEEKPTDEITEEDEQAEREADKSPTDFIETEDEQPEIADSDHYDELEKQILWEAVNASIQVDVTKDLEKLPELDHAKNSTLLDEILEKYQDEVKPVDFDGKKSFFTWLAPTNVVKEEVPQEKTIEKQNTVDLIDKFLKNDPKITPQKTEFYTPGNVAKLSITDSEDFVSETLAVIYIKQGYYTKAARVFEKLSLKFPEKSPYFAARLKELEALQKNNKK